MTRNLILLICALFALSGSIVAALATAQERDFELRGYVDATQTSDLPFRMPRLGVNAELTQYTPEDLVLHFSLMSEANVTWVRQFVRWDEIEPIQGQYDWQAWDAIVDGIASFPDLRLVAVLTNSPTWARHDEAFDDPTSSPADPNKFAEFAHEFAKRYGHVVHEYQIWDEPNILLGWGQQPPQVAHYAALLQAAYNAIHGADRNASVIAAALAPTTETGPDNLSDLIFLDQLYAYGAAEFADAFASKPYGMSLSPEDRRVDPELLNFSRIVALREIMERHGDGKKALWNSDFGWNVLPDDWAGAPSIWGGVGAETQVTYISQALDRADIEWPWVGGMLLQHWQPDKPDDHPRWGFSIIGQDGAPGPVWDMLAARLPVEGATNGHFPPQNQFAVYSGTWTFSDLGADIGWTQDSRLEFNFLGTDVALLVHEDNYDAYFYAEVDGMAANALPQDTAGNAYLQLRSGDEQPHQSHVRVARDLDNDFHQLNILAYELIPDETVHRWPLVRFAVSSGDLRAPYNRQISISVITALVAGMAVIVSTSQIQWLRFADWIEGLWGRLNDTAQLLVSFMTAWALLGSMLITWGDGAPAVFRRDSVQLGLSIATAGLIYINEFGILLTLLAGVALGGMIYHRLEVGVLLTLFWAPFFLSPVELYQYAFPIVEVILLITVVAWLLHQLAAWGRSRQTAVSQFSGVSSADRLKELVWQDWLVISWVFLGGLSLMWAERRGLAMTEFRTLVVQPALFYLVLRTIPIDRQTIFRLIGALVVAGFVVSAIGLVMWLLGEGIITAEGGARRLASVYGSPNNVGLFLGRCIPFAFALLLVVPRRKQRIILGVTLGTMGLAAILSQSVAALFIGLPTALISVLVLILRRRAATPLMLFGIILLVALIVAMQTPRFAHALDFSSGTNFYRLRVWQSTTHMISDRPVTGIGLDQFLYEYRGEYILPDAWAEPNLSHPHNFVLDFWVRLGVMGVMVFLAMQAVFWKTVWRAYKANYDGVDWFYLGISVGLMGSMLNLLSHGLVDNSVFVLDLAYVFMFLIGLPVLLGKIDPAGVQSVAGET